MIHQISTRTRRIVGRLDQGADLIKALEQLCQRERVSAGSIRVMGAVEAAELVRFDAATRQYAVNFEHAGALEIVQLGGQVALMAGAPLIRLDGLFSVQAPVGYQLVAGQIKQAKVIACEFVLDIFEDLSMDWSLDSRTGRVVLSEITAHQVAPVAAPAVAAPAAAAPVAKPAAVAAAPAPKPVAAAAPVSRPVPAPPAPPTPPAPPAPVAAAPKASEGASSYYIQIEGKRYDRKLVELAREAVAGAGDGRISREDAELLFEEVIDGDRYTQIEQDTVQYLRQEFKWTHSADDWFEAEVKKWATAKGLIAPDAATSKLAEAEPPASTMSWNDAIAEAQEAAKPASQRGAAADEPSAEEIYSNFDDDFPEINPGDHLDHPKLGRCRVMKIEDDEYAHIRLPSGKISKLMLDLFDISYAGQESNRSVFKLRMRSDKRV